MEKSLSQPDSDFKPTGFLKKEPTVRRTTTKLDSGYAAGSSNPVFLHQQLAAHIQVKVLESGHNPDASSYRTANSNIPDVLSHLPSDELDIFERLEYHSELERIPTIEIKPEDTLHNILKPGTVFSRSLLSVELVVLFYVIVTVPLKLSFYLYEDITSGMPYTDWMVKGFLFVQFVLHFFTPVYINYELESKLKVVVKELVKSPSFYLDIYAMLPWREFLFLILKIEETFTSLSVVHLSSLACLYKLAHQLQDYGKEVSDNYLWYVLKKYSNKRTKDAYTPALILLATLCHFFACLFYFVGTNYSGHNMWLWLLGKQNKSILEKYIACMYFVMQTFTSTGYGDTPVNSNSETAVRCIYMLTGVIVYALTTGEVNVELTKLMTWRQQNERKLQSLRDLASLYDIDPFIVGKVEAQILDPAKIDMMVTNKNGELVFASTNSNQLDFRNLSREEIEGFYFSLYVQKFKGLKMFQTIDSDFILQLGAAVYVREFKANQYIYTRDEPAANLFILSQGQAGFMLNRFDEIPFMRVDKGYFGEYELIFNVNRVFTVRALTDVTLYYVNTEDFKKIFLSDRFPAFMANFTFKAADRMNTFNQVHNKFDLLIKNKLSKTAAFKSVQNLLAIAFANAARRNTRAIIKNTKLTLFNQSQQASPANPEESLVRQSTTGRQSYQLGDKRKPSPFAIALGKFAARIKRKQSTTLDHVGFAKELEVIAYNSKAIPTSVRVCPRNLVKNDGMEQSPALLQPSKFRMLAKPADQPSGNILHKMNVNITEESVKSADEVESEDISDHEQREVRKPQLKSPVSPLGRRPTGHKDPKYIKQGIDPSAPVNTNPLFLAFSNLYATNSRMKR